MSLDDLRFFHPEIDFYNIDDLDYLDEFELQQIIDEFDDFDDYEDLPRDVTNNLEDITFREDQREVVIEKYRITPLQYIQAQELKQKLGVARNLSQITSHDSGIKALNQGTIQSATNDVVFVSRNDGKVCPICEDLNGEIFSVDPTTKIIDGPTIPDDTHPNCRCRYIVLGDEEADFDF
jgi:SPP1 gp7 family putative phage head morphogenesis protein